jgi:hypothetical protein
MQPEAERAAEAGVADDAVLRIKAGVSIVAMLRELANRDELSTLPTDSGEQ